MAHLILGLVLTLASTPMTNGLTAIHHLLAVQPVLADDFTNGFNFIKDDGKVIGPILLAGSGVGALLLRVLHYQHAGDYIRNILIAAPIAGTLLTGGSLFLNLFVPH